MSDEASGAVIFFLIWIGVAIAIAYYKFNKASKEDRRRKRREDEMIDEVVRRVMQSQAHQTNYTTQLPIGSDSCPAYAPPVASVSAAVIEE
jgi:hypothetical protein